MRSAFTCLSLAFEPPALPASCRWLVVFFGMALLLPPLPFRLGNTGPHLALLAAAAGVWIGVRRFSEWRWESDALTVALLTLFSILLASVAMAALYSGAVIAVGSLARVLLFGISVYVFLYLRNGPGSASSVQPSTLIRVMFWAAIIPALFTLWIRARVTESPVWLERQRRKREAALAGRPSTDSKVSLARIFHRDLIGTTLQTTLVIGSFMCIYYSVNYWYPTLLREAGRDDRAIFAASCSKTVAPGLRVG